MKRKGFQRKWLLVVALFALVSSIFYSKHQGVRYSSSIEGKLSFFIETPERWFIQTKKYFSDFFGKFETQKNLQKELDAQKQKTSEFMTYAHLLESRIQELEKKLKLNTIPHVKRFSEKIFAEVSHHHDNLPIDLYRAHTNGNHNSLQKDAVIMNHEGLAGSIMRHGNLGFDFQGVNHPRFRADIFLERTHQRGIWKGTGNDTSELTLKNYTDIKIGDLILSSGLKNKFPPHIPIGFVKHLEYTSNGLANKIKVEPLVNFDNLKYVYVLLNNSSLNTKNISLK